MKFKCEVTVPSVKLQFKINIFLGKHFEWNSLLLKYIKVKLVFTSVENVLEFFLFVSKLYDAI